ncbi:hypothetical protein B0H13DRAFT_2370284 [Mycena leptocephala]|nr:hypothetical protein B0H13DRAFT_2370284 [Mycena leptocephala]
MPLGRLHFGIHFLYNQHCCHKELLVFVWHLATASLNGNRLCTDFTSPLTRLRALMNRDFARLTTTFSSMYALPRASPPPRTPLHLASPLPCLPPLRLTGKAEPGAEQVGYGYGARGVAFKKE